VPAAPVPAASAAPAQVSPWRTLRSSPACQQRTSQHRQGLLRRRLALDRRLSTQQSGALNMGGTIGAARHAAGDAARLSLMSCHERYWLRLVGLLRVAFSK